MTEKEALNWLFLEASKQHYQLWAIKLTKPYGTRKRLVDEITSDLDNHGGELNDTFNIIEQALTELEAFKKCDTPVKPKLIDVLNRHYLCPSCEEAYKKLNDNTDGVRFIRPFSEYTLQEVVDALNELEEMKKRDTPLQPKVGTDSRGRLDFVCLNCHRDVVLKEHYCSHCGQRLDWSDGK